jgi:hypothetical protein
MAGVKSSALRSLICLAGLTLLELSPPQLAEGGRAGGPEESAPPYDLLIVGGRLVDGTGNPWGERLCTGK